MEVFTPAPNPPLPSPSCPRFQFSLRSLFCLTTVAAVLVATMTALGRTHSFRSLGSVHAYLALLPIAAVWMAWRTRLLVGQRLAVASPILFLACLGLPAIRWEAHPPLSGFAAINLALSGGILRHFGIPSAHSSILPRWPFPIHLDLPVWLACFVATIANASYILAFILLIPIPEAPGLRDVSRTLCWICMPLSVLVLVPLGLSTQLDNIYIGYGVWVAAMLAMWLRVRVERDEFVH